MDSFEWNKVFAAVIASALLIMVITTVSDSVFHKEEGKPAFTIEVAEAGSDAGAEEVAGPSLAELLANADPVKGERQWAKCRSCHTIDKGGADGTGPHLYGVVGRPIAGIAGFRYSADLAGHGGTWTYEHLDAWLKNPKAFAKGTSMGFGGLRKDDARADLIAYLASMSDSPLPFPILQPSVTAPE